MARPAALVRNTCASAKMGSAAPVTVSAGRLVGAAAARDAARRDATTSAPVAVTADATRKARSSSADGRRSPALIRGFLREEFPPALRT